MLIQKKKLQNIQMVLSKKLELISAKYIENYNDTGWIDLEKLKIVESHHY